MLIFPWSINGLSFDRQIVLRLSFVIFAHLLYRSLIGTIPDIVISFFSVLIDRPRLTISFAISRYFPNRKLVGISQFRVHIFFENLALASWNARRFFSHRYGDDLTENVLLGNKINVQITSCKIIQLKRKPEKLSKLASFH